MAKGSTQVAFFEVTHVADWADEPRRNGERAESTRRFRTEAEATDFAATVSGQAFTAPGTVSRVPAKVIRGSAHKTVAARWGW